MMVRRMISNMTREMYCPYCQETVKTGMVNWGWMLVFILLLPGFLQYTLYCLFNSARLCKQCKRRIYEVKR